MGALIELCFRALLDEVSVARFYKQNAEEAAQLEEKLKSFSSAQAAKSKKVLSRMNAGTDAGLQHMMFTAWIQFHEDYKKDKDMEDAVKQSEARIREFMKSSNEGAKSVLSRMSSSSESGLMKTVFTSWVEVFLEQKKSNELQDILNGQNSKFKEFGSRNKTSAGSAGGRAACVAEFGCLIVSFNYWKREVKVEAMRRYAKEKNNKKKQQLVGVKGLFKNFATDLERDLKDGTPRVDALPVGKKNASRCSFKG